jgi:hypothetical protein
MTAEAQQPQPLTYRPQAVSLAPRAQLWAGPDYPVAIQQFHAYRAYLAADPEADPLKDHLPASPPK